MRDQRGARQDPPTAGGAGRGAAVSGPQFAGLGVQFALTILVFVFAGVWLDRRLGTSPWLLLICVFVGASGGFYSMYRLVTRREAGGLQRGPGAGRRP